jgi:tRNA A-37 threonylcarbamoyl transferase component Bud32
VINRRNGCGVTFGFESLIPKPYRRDQPAQRLRSSRLKAEVSIIFVKKHGGRNGVLNMSCHVCKQAVFLLRLSKIKILDVTEFH